MKYRNKKAIATLIVTTLIFTCGATGVQAAPAADLNIVGNVAAAPISGVSLAVAQANTQTAACSAAVCVFACIPGSGTGKYTDSSRAGCIGTEYGGRSD